MRRTLARAALVGLALVIVGLSVWGLTTIYPEETRSLAGSLGLTPSDPQEERAIRASGSIEAEEVTISPELGGRVLLVYVEEGQQVKAGTVLMHLDKSVLLAQLQQAMATLEAARANLDLVSAPPRETVIRRAEAALAQARAQHEGALSGWWSACRIRNNPQELEAQIDEARTHVELAQEQVSVAEAQLKAAKIVRDRYEGDGSMEGKARYEIESERVQAAQAQVEAAKSQVQAARATLQLLLHIRESPVSLDTQVRGAESQAQVAKAGVEVAKAGLALAKAGPRDEEVEMAAAQVEQAEAAVAQVQAQLEKQTLRAPAGGVVSNLLVHEGEVVLPGSAVATLADLDVVELVIYVPESKIGWVRVGQPAEVTVDSFPGRVFAGQVSYISQEAEFTPRNVQTEEERVKTVFAVKIRLPNPDGSLKSGMPADAVIHVR